MESFASSGLATRSSDHGCSTGESADWYVVAGNGKHVRMHNDESLKDPSKATSFLKAALKVCSPDTKVPDDSLVPKQVKDHITKDTAGPKTFNPPKKIKSETKIECSNSYEALFSEEDSDDTEKDNIDSDDKNICGESKLDFP